ncbi:MAG: two-component regulator propeller domain-containing protein [Flavobacteriales bacterium]
MRSPLLLLMPLLLLGCGHAGTDSTGREQDTVFVSAPSAAPDTMLGKQVGGDRQITGILRRIFQDSKGHFWFGSNSEGIYRYDGNTLTWFSRADGISGSQVTGILEDRKGDIWFSTNGGVTRYDGSAFMNFTDKDGLSSDQVWCIFLARDGTIWAGTNAGLCRFDGTVPDTSGRGHFTPIDLPAIDAEAMDLGIPITIWCIAQDRNGDLWLGTDVGICVHDERSFHWLTMSDGIVDKNVTCILVDRNDKVWFGSFGAGLCRYDPSAALSEGGRSFTRFTAPDDIGDNEVWAIREDRQGNIWCSSEGHAVYRYDGKSLRNLSEKEGLGVLAVQSIFEDREGRLWFGGAGGLYRYEGNSFVNVKRNGPW